MWQLYAIEKIANASNLVFYKCGREHLLALVFLITIKNDQIAVILLFTTQSKIANTCPIAILWYIALFTRNTQHAGCFMTIILHDFTLRFTIQSTALISLISGLFSKDHGTLSQLATSTTILKNNHTVKTL